MPTDRRAISPLRLSYSPPMVRRIISGLIIEDDGLLLERLPTKRKFPRRENSVRFDFSETKEHEVPCLESLTKSDIQMMWYTQSEYREMRKEIEVTCKLLKLDFPEREGYCYRGLESAKIATSRRRKLARKLSVDVVLNNQEKNEDVHFIANLYLAHCKGSRIEAHEQGLRDAKDVESIWYVRQDTSPAIPKRTSSKTN